VVLPTRSLAVQVHTVLHTLGAAVGINVALAAAQESVAAEAAKLCTHPSQPGSGPHVLVATPGRLMAHLHGSSSGGLSGWATGSTGALSLQHLKFLVVDEADRLLRQDYQGWLPQVLERTGSGSSSSSSSSGAWAGPGRGVPATAQLQQAHGAAINWQPPGTSALLRGSTSNHSSSVGSSRVLKLVVSATLTRDPSKLMRLELCCPRYIALTDIHRRYTLPPALQQFRLVVPAQHKPLALVGLLHRLAGARTVVFASSLDMTHRWVQEEGSRWPGLTDDW